MRRIDELHLDYPLAGARMLRDLLALAGVPEGRKHVTTLMRRMGIEVRCLTSPSFLPRAPNQFPTSTAGSVFSARQDT